MTAAPNPNPSPAPAGPLFEWAVDRGVATLTLSRPEVLNALTFEVYAALAKKLRDLRDDDSVRALVITGKGRGFCSGGDVDGIIGALFECDTRDVLEFTRMTGEVIENLRRLDRPVVAAINGIAAGAGAVIALACDLRVMGEGTKFAFLFSKVGLAGADMGAAYLLPRVVGLGRATEILYLGDPVEAQTARHRPREPRRPPRPGARGGDRTRAPARRRAHLRAGDDEAAPRARGVHGPRVGHRGRGRRPGAPAAREGPPPLLRRLHGRAPGGVRGAVTR
jgi:hypothetical protein